MDAEAAPVAPPGAPLKASVSRLKTEPASPGTYSREREAHLHPRPRHHVETSSEQSSRVTKSTQLIADAQVCLVFFFPYVVCAGPN